jgi:hypothetical protein
MLNEFQPANKGSTLRQAHGVLGIILMSIYIINIINIFKVL